MNPRPLTAQIRRPELLLPLVMGTLLLLAGAPARGAEPVTATPRPSVYDVDAQGASTPEGGDPAVAAAQNPANDLRLVFAGSGMLSVTQGPASGAGSFSILLTGVGADSRLGPLAPPRVTIQGNRVDYDSGSTSQWYINLPAGLRHGILVAQELEARSEADPATLTLELSVAGSLTPRSTDEAAILGLFRSNGSLAFRYGPVQATDAKGRSLGVRVDVTEGLSTDARTVRVTIDSSEAEWPILVQASGSAASLISPTPAADEPVAGEVVGTPETLGLGITESVDQIMARERAAPMPRKRRMEESEHERERTRPVRPQDDPRAPAVSQWPPDGKSVAAMTEQVLGPQTIGTSFRAISTAAFPPDSQFVPPDPMGDVGPTQLLVHVNGRIRVFDRTGALGPLNSDDSVFWSSVNAALDQTDPEVRYDRLSGRWFLMAVNLAASNNRVMIAVSSGPTITGAESFTFFQFPLSAGGGTGDTANFCDYPSLGVDANALYIGCNMFNGTTGAFSRITAYVVRKSSILGAGPLVVTAFRNIASGSGAGPYSARGVDNDDPAATQGYLIGVDTLSFSLLQIRRFSTPGGTPTMSANLGVAVPTTTFPILQPASGSTTPIDASDDRLFMASIHKNKITGATTLWTAHNIEVNSSCVGAASGGRNGARWYEIGALSGVPALVQSGTLCDSAPATPKGYFFPSVVETGQGHMALGSSVAASNQFAGIAVSGRLRTDAAGTTRAPVTAQAGLASYTVNAFGQNRWGDYSFTDVDPNDDQTVWTVQEYADTPANNWAIRVIQLKAPLPAAPSAAAPSGICAGLTGVAVALTGTSSAGSEFFDPGPDTGGPGYANHISTSVTGGVSVTSTSFVDPTHLTLAIDTAGASAGPADVTVTNPDGQIATGTGLITINAQPAAPAASSNSPLCAGATLQLSASTVPSATYSWTGPNGFASADQNPAIPAATPAASGTYSVTVTVGGCASTAATTAVNVGAPEEVDAGVRLARSGLAAEVSWNLAGGATQSDVVRGLVSALPVGPGGGDESCLGDNVVGTTLVDGADPSSAAAFWYLVRGENVCGKGPYGFQGINGVPGAARVTTSCP